jgi:tRNA pseudouridine32 synthase/23S rRNA pseudouridine746 synthase
MSPALNPIAAVFNPNIFRGTLGTIQRFDWTIGPNRVTACEAIAGHTGLSKSQVKQAMIKGAVWLQTPASKAPRRLRRATAMVHPGQRLIVYYDPRILALRPALADCIQDQKAYSIWFKPPGLMTQGTRFGDHCALTRQVERHFQSKRQVYLVHRIDRETAGLVIMAHTPEAAALLSALFQNRRIEKRYMAWLRGNLVDHPAAGRIDLELDAKTAHTGYEILRYEPGTDQTLARIQILTGRMHQIRRHFALIGHPVMGDPRYGKANKNQSGLKLVAYALAFECPMGHGRMDIQINPAPLGFV